MPKQAQMEFGWTRTGGDGGSVVAAAPVPEAEQRSSLSQETLPGIPVVEDAAVPPTRVRARSGPVVLPVPKPLPHAIGRGHFGEDENGPIRPTAQEVRAITENHTERLIGFLDGLQEVNAHLNNTQCSDRARLYHEKDRLLSAYQGALAMYAEDFGQNAAKRLDAWARHQQRKEGR
jgi:hypothetical protein